MRSWNPGTACSPDERTNGDVGAAAAESCPRRRPARMPQVPALPCGRPVCTRAACPRRSPAAPRGQRMCPRSPPEGAADLQGRGGGAGAGASGGMGSRPLTSSRPQAPRGWSREKPLRGGGGRREPQSLGCRAQPPGSRRRWSPWGRREGAGGPSGLHAAGPGLQQAPCPRLSCSRGRPSARLEGGAFRKSLCSAF